MPSLDGRVALVTGATGGIGTAVATALAREGATVVVVGRSMAEKAAGAVIWFAAYADCGCLRQLLGEAKAAADARHGFGSGGTE